MSPLRRILRPRRHPFLVVCVLCFLGAVIATHVPPQDLAWVARRMNTKLLHPIGYAALATALLTTLAAFGLSPWLRCLLVPPSLAVYAALDELTQPWFGRHCAFNDWLADMFGALTMLVVFELATLVIFRAKEDH